MSVPTDLSDLSGMKPLGEKMKIVNKLVADVEINKVDDTLKDYAGQPKSLFNLVKLLLADKFHRFDLMVELLYDGDTKILNGILSKRWMYDSGTNSLVDRQFLMEQLFPNVSYICRKKVLHRIGRYERNAMIVDDIWFAVEKKYGFNVALPLFEACSKNLINHMLVKRDVKLSGYQVVALLHRFPRIGLSYFKKNYVQCSKMNPQCSPIHYLYENRTEDFLDLYFNHSHKLEGFKIGRNRTTKLIRKYRAKLLEYPNRTTALLKLDRIQRGLSHLEFQTLFESALPQDAPCNVEQYWKWVCKVPRYRQVNMVNEAYQNLYRIDLNENPNYMNEEYIFLLTNEQRLEAIERKIENLYNCPTSMTWSYKGLSEKVYKTETKLPFFYLPLKPINHSAPQLKNLILIEQNVTLRATLNRYLIETCYLNDDLPELLGVLEFLRDFCINGELPVRHAIFTALNRISKMEFSREHWDIIVQMIQMLIVANADLWIGGIEQIVQKYIAFRLKTKLSIPMDDLVATHIKLKIRGSGRGLSFDNVHIKNAADERFILELYAKELERSQLSDDFPENDDKQNAEILKKFVLKLIDRIWRFNCANKKSDFEPISLSSHPWLISIFEQIAKDEEQKLDQHCNGPVTVPSKLERERKKSGFLFWGPPNKLRKYIQWLRDEQHQTIDAFHGSDYYFSKMWLCLPNHQTILHFLKTNPSHLLENWTVSISKMLEVKACVALMRTLKSWNYSTLVTQTISDCTELLHAAIEVNIVNITRKCNALLVLSILMEPTEFLALVTEFYPTEKEVNVSAEKAAEDYKMREATTRSLINISIPHLAFDALKKFAVGDYLTLVIDSLYSQIQRAQPTKSLDFLRPQLKNVPLSLQKHIIHLYCTIASLDDKLEALKNVKCTDVSIRYVYFLQIDKLFRSDPRDTTWTMLKNVIESTTVDDANILEFLQATPELDTVVLEYISDYTEACLTVLRRLQPSAVDSFITQVLKSINKMPAHLLDSIFMHDSDNAESFHAKFCFAYLKCSPSKLVLKQRLSNVCRVLDSVTKSGWDRESIGQTYPTRSLVLGFLEDLTYAIDGSSKIWQERQICNKLLAKFKAKSKGHFFLETLTLHLASLHVEVLEYHGTERFRRLARSFTKLIDSLVKIYGQEIILVEIDRIVKSIKRITETPDNKNAILELVDGILKNSKSRSNQIVAINLLNDIDIPNEVKFLEMLVKINQIFIQSDDLVIQTYYASAHRSHDLNLKPPVQIPDARRKR